MTGTLRLHLLAQRFVMALLLAPPGTALAQTTVGYIDRGDGHRVFTVDDRPFLPFGGWQGVGIQPCVETGLYGLGTRGVPAPPADRSGATKCFFKTQDGKRVYFQNGRRQALRDLDAIASSGGNITFGVFDHFGRIMAPGVALSESDPNFVWWNAVPAVTGASSDGEGGRGFKGSRKPGAYVEAARWLVREAYARGIYTVIDLSSFVAPTHRAGVPPGHTPDLSTYKAWPATYATAGGVPYHGYETVSCDVFETLIDLERHVHTPDVSAGGSGSGQHGFDLDAMPAVDCSPNARPAPEMPLWEWNLWYVVQQLRDEEGLFGWHLWDEPEGAQPFNAELFGDPGEQYLRDGCLQQSDVAWTRGMRIDPDNGYLGTPNLLHYTYDLIKSWDRAAAPHPVIVDIANPWAFVMHREETEDWSGVSRWMCGPFDWDPRTTRFDQDSRAWVAGTPAFRFPADIILQETGGHFGFTAENDEWMPDYEVSFPNWDAGTSALYAAEIRRLVEDSRTLYGRPLWGSIYLARADVADRPCPDNQVLDDGRCAEPRGGFAFRDETGAERRTTEFRLRQPGNDALRRKPLTDRDIVFQSLSPLISGAAGMWWYGLRFMPLEDDPSNPVYSGFERINRFTRQFLAQDLDRALLQPYADSYAVARIEVHGLTSYVRDAPTESTPYGFYETASSYQRRPPPSGADYTRKWFGRYDPRGLECAQVSPNGAWGHAMYGDVGGERRDECGYREFPSYSHLRTSYHHFDGSYYLFVSNAFDANVTARLTLDDYSSNSPPTAEFLRFRLDGSSAIWESDGVNVQDCTPSECSLLVPLGPYETRVYRFTTSN